MIKSIELTFIGNFSDGFNVDLEICKQDSRTTLKRVKGFKLKPEPEIPKLYEKWKEYYVAIAPNVRITGIPDQATNISIREYEAQATNLIVCFNNWLTATNFGKIREEIRLHIAGTTEVRVFLASNDKLLQRLPWHLSNLFKNEQHIEVSLVPREYDRSNLVRPQSNNKILAVFGGDQGIDLEGDRKTILKLSNINPPVFLRQPLICSIESEAETLQTYLAEGQWDILIFSGHSGTRLNGGVNEGIMWINEIEPPITIKDLKTVLQDAIGKGLKLAIFNSCDGIELAEALLELKLPQVVVMREPVSNWVAEQFLKHFLTAFSDGKSLDLAVLHARRQLQTLETILPCASWLPIIYQNPAEDSLTWQKSPEPPESPKEVPPEPTWIEKFFLNLKKIFPKLKKFLSKFLPIFILAIVLPVILHYIVIFINISQRISDGEKFLVNTNELPSTRKPDLVMAFQKRSNWDDVINKFKNYLYRTDQNINSKTELKRNDPEALIYLNNAIAEKNGNYITIAVSVPIVENPDYLMGISQEILRGVAMVQNEVNQGDEKDRINGKYLKVLIAKDDNAADDKRDVVQAIANNFVANEKILAVVGHNSTKASMAAADIYKDKLLAISPTSNGENLDEKTYYRALPSNTADAEVLKKYVKDKKWNTIGICFDKSDDSSKSLKQSFVTKLKKTEQETIDDTVCDSLKEMTEDKAKTVIQKFKNEKAKALFLIPSIATIEQARMIAEENYNLDKLPLIANSAMYTSKTIERKKGDDNVKDSVKDMVLVTIWHHGINDSARSFAKTGKNKEVKFWNGGDVNWRTATSYDATKVIVEGLKKTSPSRKSLLAFVELKDRIKTITGIEGTGENDTISFESKGARDAQVKLIIIKTDGGSFKFDFLQESSNNEKQQN